VIKRPKNAYKKYHAHVYFDEDTLIQAQSICERAGAMFGVAVGRMHQKPVGPHPYWSCQLAFNASQFDALIPWLDQQRQDLNILVHGLTGNDLEDHTTHATWLGEPADLDLSIFKP
jgi:aromatic ring-cleaving dioxygenase